MGTGSPIWGREHRCQQQLGWRSRHRNHTGFGNALKGNRTSDTAHGDVFVETLFTGNELGFREKSSAFMAWVCRDGHVGGGGGCQDYMAWVYDDPSARGYMNGVETANAGSTASNSSTDWTSGSRTPIARPFSPPWMGSNT